MIRAIRYLAIPFIALLILLTGCSGNLYQEQLDLGYKYLQEEKYEEAIVAMNKAIEIDMKRPNAYVGLGDVYVTRCDENTVADASDALKRGFEQSKSDTIIQAFLDLADQLVQKGKSDWAEILLNFGYDLTENQKLKKKSEEIFQANNGEILKQLYSLCESKDYKRIAEFMASEAFKPMAEAISSEKPLYYFLNKESEEENGKGMGVYMGKDGTKQYIYFGDFDKGIRSGKGFWITQFNSQYNVYIGEWKEDAPNGAGKIEEETTHSIDEDSSNEIDYIQVSTGNLHNGLWNGKVEQAWNLSPENGPEGFTYNLKDGLIQVIKTEDYDDGFIYVVGMGFNENDGDFAMNDDQIKSTYGVSGFANNLL